MKYKVKPVNVLSVEVGELDFVNNNTEAFAETESLTRKHFEEKEDNGEEISVNTIVLSFEDICEGDITQGLALCLDEARSLVKDILVALAYTGDEMAIRLYNSIPDIINNLVNSGEICEVAFIASDPSTEIVLYEINDENTIFDRGYGTVRGPLECGVTCWVRFGKNEMRQVEIPHIPQFEYHE